MTRRTWLCGVLMIALLVALVPQVSAAGLTATQIRILNGLSPAAQKVGLGTKLNTALTAGSTTAANVALVDAGTHYTATDVEAAFTELMTRLKSVVDSSSGADLVGLTTVAGVTGASVQAAIEWIAARLQATTDSASGADFVAATTISGVTGNTVQAVLEWLCSRLQASTDSASGADFIAATAISDFGAGTTVQAILEGADTRLKATTDSASGADLIGATAIASFGASTTVQGILEGADTRLRAVTDSASGADLIGATAITAFGAAATVQAILEAIDTKLAAVTDSASGADYIGATNIPDFGAGATVQSLLEGADTRLKATTNGASGADLIGVTAISGWTGGDVQTVLESAKTYVDAMPNGPVLSLFWAGNMGHDVGVASDGVLFGNLTDTPVTYCYGFGKAQAVLECSKDGAVYTADTTDANDADADDVDLVPAAGADGDAFFVGHATKKFDRVDIKISTQGNYNGTVTWKYWNGAAYAALAGVTDGTTNFSHATGTVSVTFTVPGDWAVSDVGGVTAYWIEGELSATVGGGGAMAEQVWIGAVSGSETVVDETADIASVGVGDVAILPAYSMVGDSLYYGCATKFCKLMSTYSQARVAGTMVWEYWSGAAWSTLTTNDNSALYVTGAGTLLTSWNPPSDWATTTVNSQEAYYIRSRLSVETVTTQPLGTSAYILPFTAGSGVRVPMDCTIARACLTAQTASAANNDSVLLLVDITKGTFSPVTWTKADYCKTASCSLACSSGDYLAVVQVREDGSTEFANANLLLTK